MPTWEVTEKFRKDFADLDPTEKQRFRRAVAESFIPDIESGNGFRAGLRVKRVQGTADIWEMSWAPDGRATWQYGEEMIAGEPHVVWRRIGTHGVFGSP